MNVRGCRGLRPRIPLTLVVVMALLVGGRLVAEDFEDPLPPPSPYTGYSAFGALVVDTPCLAGLSIDAKEAIEPQTTALLAADELDGSSSGAVVACARPTYGSWPWYSVISP